MNPSELEPESGYALSRRAGTILSTRRQLVRSYFPLFDAAPSDGLVWQLMNGAISGLIAQTITYPGDTIRRRMQVRAIVWLLLSLVACVMLMDVSYAVSIRVIAVSARLWRPQLFRQLVQLLLSLGRLCTAKIVSQLVVLPVSWLCRTTVLVALPRCTATASIARRKC